MQQANIMEVMGKQFIMLEIEDPYEKVDKSWVSRYLGCSYNNLSRQPWNLPDFGTGSSKQRGKRYRKCDVVAWLAKPLHVRKQMYKEFIDEVH